MSTILLTAALLSLLWGIRWAFDFLDDYYERGNNKPPVFHSRLHIPE